nr:immunoglobulin heavy chain junction region [Mus musculus]MBK4195910.1 immunoglobulin heavy chain junction region [Mus musculus]MBK4195911.1 immunoglobulin heavy chain junction region [Mus musculus]
CARIGGAFW